MRRTGLALVCGVMLVTTVLFGCRTREPNLKPLREADVLVLPPENDSRYDLPDPPREAMKKRFNPYQQMGNPQGPPGNTGFGPGGIGGIGGPARPY